MTTLTLKDFAPYWGDSGIYNTFKAEQYTSEQIQSVINAAVQQYKLLVPCFNLNNEKFMKKNGDLAFAHIALICLYNVYKNATSEMNESKTRIERDYERLLKEFDTGIYANNAICAALNTDTNSGFAFVRGDNLNTIGS